MEISILGNKMRIEIIALCILIGWIICCNIWCGACGGLKEGFNVANGLIGAGINYSMGKNVSGSYDKTGQTGSYNSWYKSLDGNTQGLPVPLPEGQLAMFADNKNDPTCCPSTYSGSTGCVCATPQQMKYLNERGGNRTLNSEF
tara:strand:+ start:546 stop:977 length:432 start_codon:yes stop_codon:yes gene_type:complete